MGPTPLILPRAARAMPYPTSGMARRVRARARTHTHTHTHSHTHTHTPSSPYPNCPFPTYPPAPQGPAVNGMSLSGRWFQCCNSSMAKPDSQPCLIPRHLELYCLFLNCNQQHLLQTMWAGGTAVHVGQPPPPPPSLPPSLPFSLS